MQIKEGMRILCIDDAPPKGKAVLLVGVITKKSVVEGIVSTTITKDGLNSTEKIAKMINGSKFREQVKLICIHSITLGGFNIVDLELLNSLTNIPVVCVTRKTPDMEAVKKALSRVRNFKRKLEKIYKARELRDEYYYQYYGMKEREVKDFIKVWGKFPEGLRLSHLICGGIVNGESRGKA